MPDFFAVGKVTAVLVSADPSNQKKITNGFGGKLYYKNASDVSTSSTELAVGSSKTTEENLWIISETESKVQVTPLLGSTFQDVTVSDDATISDDLTVAGTGTFTEGIASTGAIPGFTTWQPVTAESGTDVAFAEKKLFTTSLFLPVNKKIKGIGYLLGAGGGTNKVIAALFNSAGTKVANSSETTEGTTAGAEKTVQELPFTAEYEAKGPGLFWIGITANGATAKLRTIPTNTVGSSAFTKEISLETKNVVPASITVPTEFVAAKGPVAFVY